VHDFVETTLDANDLQDRLLSLGDWGPVETREEAFGMNPPLSERYEEGGLLMQGATLILTQNLGGKDARFPQYLAKKVSEVTERFGVHISQVLKEAEIPEMQMPAAQPGSVWAESGSAGKKLNSNDFFDIYKARYGVENYDLWSSDPPRLKTETEEQAHSRAIATAQRLGIPEQNLDHPTVKEFVNNLHNLEDFMQVLGKGEVPPGAPGLTPSVAERYQRASHLVEVAQTVMEEGFQGRTVDPQFVANHVTSAVSYYGLQARLQIQE
jgi:hypothetical protein